MKSPEIKSIRIDNIGQILNANIEMGDLSIFIGPQASGKSIFLQTFKLLNDYTAIAEKIKVFGFNWDKKLDQFLELYFGEGMSRIFNNNTEIKVNNQNFPLNRFLPKQGRPKEDEKKEKVFYIPAQRVLTLREGWPMSFNSYGAGDPFVMKSFSEELRMMMEMRFSRGTETIFPLSGRMKESIRDLINASIFHGARIGMDRSSLKKRMLLEVEGSKLPFMTWSAGQKEFTPLLLGLYWLLPAGKVSKREDVDYVVIEEPEMGLHTEAIQSLMLIFLELIYRGYKVLISTHSQTLLELAWVLKNVKKETESATDFFKLFKITKSPSLTEVFRYVLKEKELKTFSFNRINNSVTVADISNLDPTSENIYEAEWGGLSSFSKRANEVVANNSQLQLFLQ